MNEPLFISGGHSYDRKSIMWCIVYGTWNRLRGPLAYPGTERDAAIRWAQGCGC